MIEEAGELLWWLRRNGFTQHVIGGDDPTVMVFVRPNLGFIDLVHIRGADRTEAARIPFDEFANIWRPEIGVWHYYGGIIDALTQLVLLPAPDQPVAPKDTYAIPRAGTPSPLFVSEEERRQDTTVT